MGNVKALSRLVWKKRPRLKILHRMSNFKVNVKWSSNIMVPFDRFCQMEYTCTIWQPYLVWFEGYESNLWPKVKYFKSRSNFKANVTGSKRMTSREMSCHTEYTCGIWKPFPVWFGSYGQVYSCSKVSKMLESGLTLITIVKVFQK